MFTPLIHQKSFSSLELSSLSKSRTAKFLEKVNKKVDKIGFLDKTKFNEIRKAVKDLF